VVIRLRVDNVFRPGLLVAILILKIVLAFPVLRFGRNTNLNERVFSRAGDHVHRRRWVARAGLYLLAVRFAIA